LLDSTYSVRKRAEYTQANLNGRLIDQLKSVAVFEDIALAAARVE
jgi:hypothetical protein